MKLYNIKNILAVFLLAFSFSSCSLDLQKNEKFEGSVLDPHIEVNAWEFFQNRQDLFSVFTEAIEYTEMTNYYTQDESMYTYLAINNTGMKKFMEDEFPGKKSITECDKDRVKDLLLYHIIDGEYSAYGDLPVEPMFVLTMLKGEQGLMTILVRKNPWQADAGKVVINDEGSNSKSPMKLAVTSNIMATNGVIHIFDSYCKYNK